MKNGFTKIYDEEKPLLNQTKSIAAFNVYMHLKDKYSYFKQDVYDYMNYMAEYLGMTERTVKDAIKRLKDVGLIQTKREWVYTDGKPKSINIYSFPIVDKIEKDIEIEHKQEQTKEEKQTSCIVSSDNLVGIILKEKFYNMKGNLAIEIEDQDLTNEEIIKNASNDFIIKQGIDAYNLWSELNNRYRNGEENTSYYQSLWKKWVDMWRPFICTQRRIDLQAEITTAAVKRYGKRYYNELKRREEDNIERQTETQVVAKEEELTFTNGFSDRLEDFLDENETELRRYTDIIAKCKATPSGATQNTLNFYTNKLDQLIEIINDSETDVNDFKTYIEREITRKVMCFRNGNYE